MIPGDLGAELAGAVARLVASGVMPEQAARVQAAGTWRPAPAGAATTGTVGRVGGAVAGAGGGAERGMSGGDAAGAGEAAAARAASVASVAAAASVTAAGAGAGASYATSVAFELGRLAGEEPRVVAGWLAAGVRGVPWIFAAELTGDGYLTLTVTRAALTRVAVRVTEAGAACLRSDELGGIRRAVPPLPDLRAAGGWRQAWRDQTAALDGRLAIAAGAAPDPAADGGAPGDWPAAQSKEKDAGGPRGGAGAQIADAVAYAGADAVRYWLARLPANRVGCLDRMDRAARVPAWPRDRGQARDEASDQTGNQARDEFSEPTRGRARGQAQAGGQVQARGEASDPARGQARGQAQNRGQARARVRVGGPAAPFAVQPLLLRELTAVRLARDDAAAVSRRAAELGLTRAQPPAGPAGLALREPEELALLTELSWLPERVASAARRRQPGVLPRHLERIAAAWQDCAEACPALPFGGARAPRDAAGVSARLWLAAATDTALAAGLRLTGVTPDAGCETKITGP